MFKFLSFCAAGLLLLSPGSLRGQTSDGYTPIALDNLNAFEAPSSSWKVTPEVIMSPTNATVMSKDGKGGGILVGTAGKKLTTKVTMQDLRLRFGFMLSPGARAYITLPGGSRVLLAEGGPVNGANISTSGYTGTVPIQNATKAAGLWQTMELSYDASTIRPDMARLNSLILNSVAVQQGDYFPLPRPVSGDEPLAFEVIKGTVAFRNIGYQISTDRRPLSVSNITYKLYLDPWQTEKPEKLEREGSAPAITQELGKGLKEFQLYFEGDLNVEDAGDYLFALRQSGPRTRLSVDGKEVVSAAESRSQVQHFGTVRLEKGKHRIELLYTRFSWFPPALGVSVSKAGIRPYDLTALSSLPVPPPKPYLGVDPEGGPEMIRSFIQYQGEEAKRTHAVSVGSTAGWHYTIDLNRGALLQAWRGPFADVTDMWYERGEPQLLETAGLTVPISGKSSYAALSSPSAAWPDSAELNYLGYRLSAGGVPALRYAFGNATLTDQLAADAQGLTRTISVEGGVPSGMYALLGSGENITMVEKGLYRVDDRFYVRVDKNARVVLRNSAGKQELLLPLGGSVTYRLFW